MLDDIFEIYANWDIAMVAGENQAGLNGRTGEMFIFFDIIFGICQIGFNPVVVHFAKRQTFVFSGKAAAVKISIGVKFDFNWVGDKTFVTTGCFDFLKLFFGDEK